MNTLEAHGIDTRGRSHGNVKTTCPQCSHTRRNHKEMCLSVDVDRGVWKCHHCGWSGHLASPERGSYSSGQKLYAKPDPGMVVPIEAGSAYDWMQYHRGIWSATMLRAGVSASGSVVQFPYRRDSELINIKNRSVSEKKFWMEKDCELIWYGLDWCAGEDTIYVVEGEIDALTLRQIGFNAVLSPPNGAPPVGTAPRLDYFESGMKIFERATTVVMAGDADPAGQSLIAELVRRIGVEKCKRVVWPEGIKDANECYLRKGEVETRMIVAEASHYPVAGIITADDELEEVMRLHRDGMPRGIPTGWPSLDNLYSVVPGYFTVVTGIPGSGKSEFMDNLMINVSRSHQWKWLVFSPEGAPTPSHIGRLIEKYWGKPFLPTEAGHTGSPRMVEEEVLAAHSWVNDHVQFVVPEDPTIDELLRLARVDVMRRGTQGIVIDPWNEIQHNRPSNVREDEYLSEQLRKIRQFAERHQVHVFVINHPHALQWDQKTGQYPVVKGYDLHGGSMWLNKTGGLLSVWRDAQEPSQPVSVYVLKTKTRQIGKRGWAKFYFQRPTGRYEDAHEWEVMG